MLRMFTYDKAPLSVHNERFAYNYAVVYQGFIEMRSTRSPGKFILVRPEDLVKAVYQPYHVEFRRFIVWYKEESHLDAIRDKIECPNSQPEFKKMKYTGDARDAYRHTMDSWLADKLPSTVYYFIDATTQELRMGTVLNGYYEVSTAVDKITSPPLSDYVVMSLITNERDAKVKGDNDNYNAMFDENDVILEWFADELPLVFRIGHTKELPDADPRYEYVDVQSTAEIDEEYLQLIIQKRKKAESEADNLNHRLTFIRFSHSHLQNFVLWKEDGLYMRFTKCDDELKVDASELSKTFYGDYDLRDLPVKLYYKDDYELEILMKACVTKNYVLEHRELVPGENPPYPWYLMPGDIPLGMSHAIEHWNSMKIFERVARIFYFVENDRIFCSTLGMGWKGKCIQVDQITDCPRSYYNIAEMVSGKISYEDSDIQIYTRQERGSGIYSEKFARALDGQPR
ncbi:hypothetical protein Cantr_02159 [Candida viswanathii]|uniref:Uncharacterized protein n=1 Tax=Candida viswanathii TaxID=5486 RepID=A0A367YKF5_9ASCO|nr:hypothetical protein Cantr_02159 [Candida viswanathii]